MATNSLASAIHARHQIDRQVIRLNGVTRFVVPIPDYQIKIDPSGPYHRLGAIDSETACGQPLASHFSQMREYILDPLLCCECFTHHELELGIAAGYRRGRW